MTKTNTYKRNKTNAREAHKPAPSSPSEVITMLKGITKHEDKEHGENVYRKVKGAANPRHQAEEKND